VQNSKYNCLKFAKLAVRNLSLSELVVCFTTLFHCVSRYVQNDSLTYQNLSDIRLFY